jgi:uncharacterized coiled-coil protein SlyX
LLLNEFLKEHRKVEEQQATIAQQRKDFQASITKLGATIADQQTQYQSQIAEQQRQIKGLSAALEKLDAKMEMRSAALRTAANARR